MVEKADLDPKLRQEVDFAKDDELDALGAKIVGKIHLHDVRCREHGRSAQRRARGDRAGALRFRHRPLPDECAGDDGGRCQSAMSRPWSSGSARPLNKLQTAARNFHDVQATTTEATGLLPFKPSPVEEQDRAEPRQLTSRAPVLEYFSGNITAQIKQRYGSFEADAGARSGGADEDAGAHGPDGAPAQGHDHGALLQWRALTGRGRTSTSGRSPTR